MNPGERQPSAAWHVSGWGAPKRTGDSVNYSFFYKMSDMLLGDGRNDWATLDMAFGSLESPYQEREMRCNLVVEHRCACTSLATEVDRRYPALLQALVWALRARSAFILVCRSCGLAVLARPHLEAVITDD